jgi:hypothetical protein
VSLACNVSCFKNLKTDNSSSVGGVNKACSREQALRLRPLQTLVSSLKCYTTLFIPSRYLTKPILRGVFARHMKH